MTEPTRSSNSRQPLQANSPTVSDGQAQPGVLTGADDLTDTFNRSFNYEVSVARLGGDPQLFFEILALFLEDSPALLAQGRQAIAQSDVRGLERSSHSLKGLAANFEALPLVHAAQRVEQLARHGDLPNASDTFVDMERELARLQRELREFQQHNDPKRRA